MLIGATVWDFNFFFINSRYRLVICICRQDGRVFRICNFPTLAYCIINSISDGSPGDFFLAALVMYFLLILYVHSYRNKVCYMSLCLSILLFKKQLTTRWFSFYLNLFKKQMVILLWIKFYRIILNCLVSSREYIAHNKSINIIINNTICISMEYIIVMFRIERRESDFVIIRINI